MERGRQTGEMEGRDRREGRRTAIGAQNQLIRE